MTRHVRRQVLLLSISQALLSSLSVGALLTAVGWKAMNLLLLPWLAICAVALGALGWRQRSATVRQIA